MKKINTLILLIATIGMISLTSYASSSFEPMPGFGFYYGAGFGSGFGGGFGMVPVGFGGMDFGPFSYVGSFGGFGAGFGGGAAFGAGMFSGNHLDGFGSFAGMDFNSGKHSYTRKIVPIPPVASAASSITYDDSGEIHIRPFDDEDLFAED